MPAPAPGVATAPGFGFGADGGLGLGKNFGWIPGIGRPGASGGIEGLAREGFAVCAARNPASMAPVRVTSVGIGGEFQKRDIFGLRVESQGFVCAVAGEIGIALHSTAITFPDRSGKRAFDVGKQSIH